MGAVRYASRDDVLRATGLPETARVAAQVDRHLLDASRDVESLCHRRFHPSIGTREIRVDARYAATVTTAWREYLDRDTELLALTTATLDDTAVEDWWLGPQNPDTAAGWAPYTYLDLDQSAGQVLTLAGTFGGCNATRAATTLDGAHDASTAVLVVVDSAHTGVGAALLIDTEWLTVEGRTLRATGQTLTGGLDESAAHTLLTVADPTALHIGEQLTVDAERMLVEDVTAAGVLVERAYAGSPLAAHTVGAVVYAPRTLTVDRGQLGTTAATHLAGAVVRRLNPPPSVVDLVIGETLDLLAQEQTSYARTIGGAEFARNATGRGLADKRRRVQDEHGRALRKAAV